jgi:preprotein translocase subunit SecA
MAEKAANFTPEIMRMAEKSILLQVLDQAWKEHLLGLDHLRQGIGLRAYGQRDPLNEYKREAFTLFESMLTGLRETVTMVLSHLELRVEAMQEVETQRSHEPMYETHEDPALQAVEERATGTHGAVMHPAAALRAHGAAERVLTADADPADVPAGWRFHPPIGRWIDPYDPASWGKVPRNAACPCGSGKKYKHCHG